MGQKMSRLNILLPHLKFAFRYVKNNNVPLFFTLSQMMYDHDVWTPLQLTGLVNKLAYVPAIISEGKLCFWGRFYQHEPFRWLNRLARGTVKTGCVLALQHCGSDAAVTGRWWSSLAIQTELTLTFTFWSKPSIWLSSSSKILCTSLSAAAEIQNSQSFVKIIWKKQQQ